MKQAQMQADAAKAQADSESEIKRLQMQAQVDQHQADLDAQLAQAKASFEQQKADMENQVKMAIAKLDSETKIAVAQISAKTQLQAASISKSNDVDGGDTVDSDGNVIPKANITDLMTVVVDQLRNAFSGIGDLKAANDGLAQSHMQLAAQIAQPKTVVRDANGNIIGVQ